MRGRAAAEEDRLDRLRRTEARQLHPESVEIRIDEVILSDGDGEVAVTAVMGAEGNVQVGGARPEPAGTLPVAGLCAAQHNVLERSIHVRKTAWSGGTGNG